MMTKVKLCGLTQERDILCANALLPAYIGFVFAPKSRRCISPEEAAALKRRLDPRIAAVGVFVDAPLAQIVRLLREGVIDMAQLHGAESEDDIAALRAAAHKPIIKAFQITGPADVAAARASTADLVLLDSQTAGSGTAFDWKLIQTIDRPFFLAGGLDETNVGAAIQALHPYAVDVSSGIETNGAKDPIKMRNFVCAAKERNLES